MKVLLDENLPQDLRHFLTGHEVFTVGFLGWKGIENGALLAKAAGEQFGVVVTMDAGIEYEQNLGALPVAVVLLQAPSNALEVIRSLVPALLKALGSIQPCTLVRIGA